MFRGREQSHPERGRDLLMRLAEDVKEIGQIESPPLQDGRNMVMVLGPTKAAGQPVEAAQVPKQKTNKATKKRFKVTGGGPVLRRHAMKSHNLEKKSAKAQARVPERPAGRRAGRARGQAPARQVEEERCLASSDQSTRARSAARCSSRRRATSGQPHVSYRKAKEQVIKADVHAYRDRKNKKRVFRRLWIVRINAAARKEGSPTTSSSPAAGRRTSSSTARCSPTSR